MLPFSFLLFHTQLCSKDFAFDMNVEEVGKCFNHLPYNTPSRTFIPKKLCFQKLYVSEVVWINSSYAVTYYKGEWLLV